MEVKEFQEKLSFGLKWTLNTLCSAAAVNLWGPEEHFFLKAFSRENSAILAKEILCFFLRGVACSIEERCDRRESMPKYGLHLSYLRLLWQQDIVREKIQFN